MVLRHLGCDVQIGSTTSNTSTAVLAGFNVTATGSGIGGICSVIIGLGPPVPDGAGSALWAVADPAYVPNASDMTTARINELMGISILWTKTSNHLF
jgi:hypothetical protein